MIVERKLLLLARLDNTPRQCYCEFKVCTNYAARPFALQIILNAVTFVTVPDHQYIHIYTNSEGTRTAVPSNGLQPHVNVLRRGTNKGVKPKYEGKSAVSLHWVLGCN